MKDTCMIQFVAKMNALLCNIELNLGLACLSTNFNERCSTWSKILLKRVYGWNKWPHKMLMTMNICSKRPTKILENKSVPMTPTKTVNSKNCNEQWYKCCKFKCKWNCIKICISPINICFHLSRIKTRNWIDYECNWKVHLRFLQSAWMIVSILDKLCYLF